MLSRALGLPPFFPIDVLVGIACMFAGLFFMLGNRFPSFHATPGGNGATLRGDFPALAPLLDTLVGDEPAFHSWCMISLVGSMAMSFCILMGGVPAVYGRYNINRSSLWGFDVNGKVAWIVQEAPNLVVAALCWRYGDPHVLSSPANRFLLFLFTGHYFNRTCIFPLLIRGGKNTPVSVMFFAFAFCTVNGYIQSRWLCTLYRYDDNWVYHPQFLVGVCLFIAGFFFNNQADSILRNLRKPGDTSYHIPRGGLFEYVSGANFAGEILEWTGFAIASNSWPGIAFAAATFLNTAPRGYQHHCWYLQKFDGYERLNRNAVIPFVW